MMPMASFVVRKSIHSLALARLGPPLMMPEASKRSPVPSLGYTATTGMPLLFSVKTLPSPVTPMANSPRLTSV